VVDIARLVSGQKAAETAPCGHSRTFIGSGYGYFALGLRCFLNSLLGVIDDAEMSAFDKDGIARLREAYKSLALTFVFGGNPKMKHRCEKLSCGLGLSKKIRCADGTTTSQKIPVIGGAQPTCRTGMANSHDFNPKAA
jgi:hypothetical protein